MRHRVIRPLVLAATACLIAAPIALAGSPAPVRITLDADFSTGVETFTATGGFCPSGTAETTDLWIVGNGWHALSFHVEKTLTCGDGSGTLRISLNAATHAGSGGDQGGWRVAGGTGDWDGATGGGLIVGRYTDSGVVDVYTGTIRP